MSEEPITNTINTDTINTESQPSPVSFNKIIDQLTLNLKVMGDVKSGDKLSVVNKNFEIDTYSYVRCIYRSYYGDSRIKSLEKVNEVVEDVIKATDQLLNLEPFAQNIMNLPDNPSKHLQDLMPDMINANKGLDQLKLTYLNDVLTENKLNIMIKKMSDQIDKIKNNMKISKSPIC